MITSKLNSLLSRCNHACAQRCAWLSLTAALLLLTLPVSGQALDWVNQPLAALPFGGNDEARAIALDASGNVYVTGYFFGTADFDPGAGTANLSTPGDADIFIAKYDASGNYVWAKQIGGASTDMSNAIAVDGSGNVLITGRFSGTADFDPGTETANLSTPGDEDIFIAKYDASGNYVWAKQLGGTSDLAINSHGIALDGSGNVHITGYFQGSNVDFDPGAGMANLSSAGDQNMFLAKYDASGNYVWAKEVGGTTGELVYGYGIALDGSGNVHITGSFEGFSVDFDPGIGTANLYADFNNSEVFVAKYDASGNYVWAKQVVGTYNDIGYGVSVDGSGNVHITGYFQGDNVDFDPGAGTANLSSIGSSPDIFVAKYDASGNYLWAKQMGGTGYDIGYGIAVDGSNNAYITGYFSDTDADFDPGAGTAILNSAGAQDIFIAKYDVSGNFVWAKQVYGALNDAGAGIAVDDSGNACITGYFSGLNADFDPGAATANLNAGIDNNDAFVLHLSSAGNYQWAINIGKYGSKPTYMECLAIARDASGNVYATGLFEGSNVDFDPAAGAANLSSAGVEDVFIAKYDASGNYLWAKQVGGIGYDIGYGIAVDGSGNVYVSGGFHGLNVDFDPGAGTANLSSAGDYDIFFAKYDASGNYVWAKQVGGPSGDYAPGIAVDGSGNAFLTGQFYGTVDFDPGAGTTNLNSAGYSDIFLAKYDASGNYVWVKQAGGSGFDGGNGIALDVNGNVHVTGYFAGSNVDFDPGAGAANLSSAGNSDIFIAKYDASGNYTWAKQAGGTDFESGLGIALDGNGNIHVTGYFNGTADFDPSGGTANLSSAGAQDIFLAKYDLSGNYVWAKKFGGTYNDVGKGIAVDGSGNVHVTGYFYYTVDFDPGTGTANLSSMGGYDIFLAKYSASGNYESAISIGSTNTDRAYCVAAGGNGRVYVGGSFSGAVDFDPGPGVDTRTAVSSSGDLFIAQYGPISVSGTVVWEHDDVSGVNNATVNLTGSATGSDLTDTNGEFLITTGVSGGSFILKPVKNINKFNGVTVGDIILIQQHVANILPITDNYKKVCADINKSNSITSLDVSVLNQALLGNPTANAIFNTSWRFVPASHVMNNPPWGFPEQRTYSNIFRSQTNQNFIGMKIGDVTGNANPTNFNAGPPLVLQDKDQVLLAGDTLMVAFSVDQMDNLAAFQCALRFDPDQLQFVEIHPATGGALPLTMDNFGMYNITEGEIRFVWAQPTAVAVTEATPVFRIHFIALQSGAKLSEVLQLDESELPALAYTGALEESKVKLKFSELTATGDAAGTRGMQLFQNRPNPFCGATTIDFVLPEACEAQLRVFDVSGRMLAEHKAQYPAGKNEALFEVNGATGVLYYELTTPFGVVAKKMVAVKN